MKKRIIIVIGLLFIICYAIGCDGLNNLSIGKDDVKFFDEIYLRHTSGKVPKDTFRISTVERCLNGSWRISIINAKGEVVSGFAASQYDEYPIVYLTPANKSGIYGYAKVNWQSIPSSSSVDFSKEQLIVDSKCFDPKNSPTINKTINARAFYVSSSEGKIGNLGLSSDAPAPSIASVLHLRRDKKILLKSGDVFYENINCLDANATLGSYGTGAKPILSGWKILKKKSGAWQEGKMSNGVWISEKGTHIWRIDLEADLFEGRLKGNSKFLNDIGLIMDKKSRKTYGRKVEFMYKSECTDPYSSEQNNNYLEHELDFFQTSKIKSLNDKDYRYLYIYSTNDPSSLDLMFSTYGSGVVMNNSSIDDIQIEGFGCHGIGAGSNVKITNCEIRYVGGSQHVSYNVWARYGNGVEFYLSENKENGYVANNRVSKVFDCGMTIQGNATHTLVAKDIVIEKNVIDSCRQSFEFFLNDGDEKNVMDCKNCCFRGNLCLNAGKNGFGCPEKRDLHILSYQKNHKSTFVIENNLFFGGNGLYCAMFPDLMSWGSKNKYYFVDNVILWNQGFRGKNMIAYDKGGMHNKNINKYCSAIATVKLVQCSSSEYEKYLNESKESFSKR